MFDILSFLIPLLIGVWAKNKKAEGDRLERAYGHTKALRNDAFERSNAEDLFTKICRVPVRPIITYMGMGSFYLLPFIPAFFPDVVVHIEVCEDINGLWAWLTTGTGEFCEYKTLQNGIMWTNAHIKITLAIAGYWFGSR